jgi:hypothetical protein
MRTIEFEGQQVNVSTEWGYDFQVSRRDYELAVDHLIDSLLRDGSLTYNPEHYPNPYYRVQHVISGSTYEAYLDEHGDWRHRADDLIIEGYVRVYNILELTAQGIQRLHSQLTSQQANAVLEAVREKLPSIITDCVKGVTL